MQKKSCATCRYYGTGEHNDEPTTGRCRRHAPRPHALALTYEEAKEYPHEAILETIDGAFAKWPTTYDSDWCGEWRKGSEV